MGGYHEYRGGIVLLFEYPHGTEHPHGTHDIRPHISRYLPQYSNCKGWYSTKVLTPPTVLMIFPMCIMTSPMVLSIPHGTQDNPHGTHDISYGTQDIQEGGKSLDFPEKCP